MPIRRSMTVLCAMLVIAIAWMTETGRAQSIRRAKAPITVSPTVHVSKAFPNLAHYENLAAGDPARPGRLTTCTTVWTDTTRWMIYQYCYVTFDGGKTWEPTLKLEEVWGNQDPAVVYGRGDDVYAVSLISKEAATPKDPDPDAVDPELSRTVVFKSADGGRTWAESARFQFIDREYLDVDRTDGKYAGRLYLVGQGSVKGLAGSSGHYSLQIFRSLDGGKTFLGPVHAEYPVGSTIFGVGTGAVLSDGTFVVLFGLSKPGRQQNLEVDPSATANAELHVIMSKTGGETFTKSQKIADIKLDRPRSEGGILNQMVADPGSKAFKDRLYAVFPAIVDDRIQIQVSYSADKGKTWSKPATVNDDRSPQKGGSGPDHLLPSIGVNKDGVVLVSWYDRRDAKDNLGWRLRAAASLDGGETFTESVPITEAANSYTPTTPWLVASTGNSDEKSSTVSVRSSLHAFFASAGHTTGLAVDADGTFHPTWVDNRTGVPQLWSASLKVDGTAVKHGATELTELEDISKSVTLQLSKSSFDRAKSTLTMTAQLKNTSKDTIQAPVKVRVLTLESALGVAEITNADNGQNGTGAVWDFTPQVSGGTLGSMQLSSPRTLTFRITDVRPLSQGRDYKAGLLAMDTRILGKLIKAKPDTTEDKAKGSETR